MYFLPERHDCQSSLFAVSDKKYEDIKGQILSKTEERHVALRVADWWRFEFKIKTPWIAHDDKFGDNLGHGQSTNVLDHILDVSILNRCISQVKFEVSV